MDTYDLAIFDFDGTLADSFPFFVSVYNDLADRYRFRRVAAEEVAELRALEASAIMRRVGMPLWKLPLVAGEFKRLMAGHRSGIPLFPGIAAALTRLDASGVKLAIVSSNSADNVTAVVGAALAPLIGHFECGATIFGKRRLIDRVLKRSGVAKERAIYVGDQITDLEAARAAGIAFGAVAWGYAEVSALEAHRPERVFRTVDDLSRLLSGPGPAPL